MHKHVRHEQGINTAAFSYVYQKGTRYAGKSVLLVVRVSELGYSRLGLSVGKKLGGAVTRNLIKRRLRSIYLDLFKQMPQLSVDVLIIVKKNQAVPGYAVLRNEISSLLTRAGVLKR